MRPVNSKASRASRWWCVCLSLTVLDAPEDGRRAAGDLGQLHGGVGGGGLHDHAYDGMGQKGVAVGRSVWASLRDGEARPLHARTLERMGGRERSQTPWHYYHLASLGRLPPQHLGEDRGHLPHRVQGPFVLSKTRKRSGGWGG